MMRVGLASLALVFIALAIPAIARTDSAAQRQNRIHTVVEGGRAVLSIAAASVLFLLAMRAR